MNEVASKIFILICARAFAAFAVYRFIKAKARSKAIDSIADARVIKVLTLGRSMDGKSQFAITYQVLIDKPFEIIVTPTNTLVEMGSLVTIYYDSLDHSNYYIPTKWKIDDRMKKAWTLLIAAIVAVGGCILSFFQ